MSTSTATTRPASVTIVFVLALLSGIGNLVNGILLTFFGGAAAAGRSATSGAVIAAGVVYLVLGIITLAVAFGIRNGSSRSRMIITVLMVINIVGGIVVLFTVGSGQVAATIVAIVFAAVTLALLWNKNANAFFAGR